MYVVVFIAAHALVGTAGAVTLASQAAYPASALTYLLSLGGITSAVSGVCFAATNRYLSQDGGLLSGIVVGALCGAVSMAMVGLALVGISLPLAQFLAVFVPGLLAVLLASLVRGRASGWQP